MSSILGTDRFTGDFGYVAVSPVGGGTSTRLDVDGWTHSTEADEHDVTDTGSGGNGVYLFGIKRGTVQIDLKFNAAANPLDGPPALVVGALVAAVLYLNSAASAPTLNCYLWVKSVSIASKVSETTTISIGGRITGPFNSPSGNFTPST